MGDPYSVGCTVGFFGASWRILNHELTFITILRVRIWSKRQVRLQSHRNHSCKPRPQTEQLLRPMFSIERLDCHKALFSSTDAPFCSAERTGSGTRLRMPGISIVARTRMRLEAHANPPW